MAYQRNRYIQDKLDELGVSVGGGKMRNIMRKMMQPVRDKI